MKDWLSRKLPHQVRSPGMVIIGSALSLIVLRIIHDAVNAKPQNHTWSVFWESWGAPVGVAFTVLLAAVVALLPSHLERELKGVAERIQSPLNSFAEVITKATSLLEEIGTRPDTVFKFVSACPVLGLELDEARRNRWRTLLISRIEAGCKTEMVCLNPRSSTDVPVSSLASFCKTLVEKYLHSPDRFNELYKYATKQIDTFQSYSNLAHIRLGAEPPFQIIIARNEQGYRKAILYFSSTATLDRSLPVSGFVTEDARMGEVLEMLFKYVSDNAVDPARDPRSPVQRERDFDLQLCRDKRVHDYELPVDQVAPGFKLLVKPEVFPPDIALAQNAFSDAIDAAVKIVWKETAHEHRFGVDIGTGTGILSLFLAKHAPHVLATDIGNHELINARENISRYKKAVSAPSDIRVIQSFLLESVSIPGNVKPLIVFNHTYYPSPSNVFNVGGLKAGLVLIEPFLTQAKSHVENGGGVLMPYSEMAGEHSPLVVATKAGYRSTQLAEHTDLKYGAHYIYLFTL